MIAINGYKMPKDCVNCVMQMGGWCGVSPAEVDERVAETVEDAINNGKPDWCPLVEIDAEPVRRGRWIAVSSFDACGGDEEAWMAHGNPTAYHYCSECKNETYLNEEGKEILSDYCPFCGADLREEGADNG